MQKIRLNDSWQEFRDAFKDLVDIDPSAKFSISSYIIALLVSIVICIMFSPFLILLYIIMYVISPFTAICGAIIFAIYFLIIFPIKEAHEIPYKSQDENSNLFQTHYIKIKIKIKKK